MPEPAWRAAEEEWSERESVRFHEGVANDPTVAKDADGVAQLYLDGELVRSGQLDSPAPPTAATSPGGQ